MFPHQADLPSVEYHFFPPFYALAKSIFLLINCPDSHTHSNLYGFSPTFSVDDNDTLILIIARFGLKTLKFLSIDKL
jgi:hypothetical protein